MKIKSVFALFLVAVLCFTAVTPQVFAAEGTYFVAGEAALCGSEWEPADTANQMVLVSDGIYEITYTAVAAGTYEFKVTDGTWTNSWGGDGANGNYTLTVASECDVTIRFDSSTYEISVSGDGLSEEVVSEGYFVAGEAALCGSAWDPADTANQMTEVSEGVYEITYVGVVAGTYEFKVTDGTWSNCWGASGSTDNYVLTVAEDGDVTIRFDSTTQLITVVTPGSSEDGEATDPVVETAAIYFDSTNTGWTTVNVYYWGGTSTVVWPGVAMTQVEGTETEWVYQVPTDATMILFNNGEAQTEDLTIPTDGKNCCNGFQWVVYGEEFDDDVSGMVNDNITWTLVDGVLTISGTGAMEDYDVGDAPWYSYRGSVKSVVICDGVTEIGNYAFVDCGNLTTVTFPNSLTTIGQCAFAYCTSLAGVVLPSSLTTLVRNAFYNCTGLTEINIPKALETVETYSNAGQGPFEGCSNLKTVIFETGITQIPSYLFDSCDGIERIDIPDTVTVIDRYAFVGCGNLTTVTLPDSVTTIGQCAFSDCTSLTGVVLPSSLTTLIRNAFYNCTGLTEINIPKSLETVETYSHAGQGPFEGCSNLKTVIFETGIT